jgi:hypothetical protein
MAEEKNPYKVQSVKKMRDIMTLYYMDAKTAEQNNKKWRGSPAAGGGTPHRHGRDSRLSGKPRAMIGASKMGVDLCERAERMGYSSDLCSYARSDIACATVNGGPIGGLPRRTCSCAATTSAEPC